VQVQQSEPYRLNLIFCICRCSRCSRHKYSISRCSRFTWYKHKHRVQADSGIIAFAGFQGILAGFQGILAGFQGILAGFQGILGTTKAVGAVHAEPGLIAFARSQGTLVKVQQSEPYRLNLVLLRLQVLKVHLVKVQQ
jgi:hypothetical protein